MLAVAALCLLSCHTDKNKKIMENNPAIDALLTRVSVRYFTTEKPSEEQINLILRAGMAAPTAVNKQPWAFIVVDEPELLKEIGERLPNSRVQNDAQVAIVVCGDMSKALEGEVRDFWIQDASAATENILLAVHALGLGAVWTGLIPSVERSNVAREILNVPEHLVPFCIIPIGYPAEQPQVKDKFKEENIHYNKW